MKNTPATQKEIAQAAGVSQNTVSLALRGDTRVSSATRERIRDLAQRMGYRPNPLVSALMAQMKRRRPSYTSTLALVMEGPRRKELPGHPSLERALSGARERAGSRGYRVEVFWLQDTQTPISRLESILSHRAIHGIIWHPRLEATDPPALSWNRFAAAVLAVLDRRFAAFHSASAQPFRHIETALEELKRRGCRRPALAMPGRYEWIMDRLYSGAMLTLPKRLGFPLIPPFSASSWSREGFLRWLEKKKPDAVLTRSPELLDWCRSAGIRVPEEVSLLHLGWNERLRDWAGIDPAAESIGAAAADLVIDQLNANERGIPAVPKMVLTGGRWVEGKTVRSVKEAGE
jgi:DNA-binding LacI/PurR family transcriptional regulator